MEGKELIKLFKDNIFEFGYEYLVKLSEQDKNLSISNVLNGINKEFFGFRYVDENIDSPLILLDYARYDINKGYLGFTLEIDIKFNDKIRTGLIMTFSAFLSSEFEDLNTIDVFNTYQRFTKSVFEKIGYLTYSEKDIPIKEGETASIFIPPSMRKTGLANISFIDTETIMRSIINDFHQSIDNVVETNKNSIYIILNPESQNIKIGRSKNPVTRLNTFLTSEPKLKLICSWDAPINVENKLHERFKSKRIDREWFNLKPSEFKELVEFMSEYRIDIH